jgi:hypothetical protein
MSKIEKSKTIKLLQTTISAVLQIYTYAIVIPVLDAATQAIAGSSTVIPIFAAFNIAFAVLLCAV